MDFTFGDTCIMLYKILVHYLETVLYPIDHFLDFLCFSAFSIHIEFKICWERLNWLKMQNVRRVVGYKRYVLLAQVASHNFATMTAAQIWPEEVIPVFVIITVIDNQRTYNVPVRISLFLDSEFRLSDEQTT